jgi:hypothetical protein
VERVVVGLAAVTLLFSAGSQGRADYIVVCHLAAPTNSSGQFPSARSLTGDPAENPSLPEALSQHIHFFANSLTLLVDFGDLGSLKADAGRHQAAFLPTIQDPVGGNWLKLDNPQLSIDGSFPGPFNRSGLPDVQFNSIPGLSASLFEAVFVADTIDLGGEISTGGSSFLARFGGLDLGDTQAAEPPRIVAGPAGKSSATNRLSDPKVLLSLGLVALGVLGVLGYAWRRRKRRLRRILRGPRRATFYRSPSLPWPPGRTP